MTNSLFSTFRNNSALLGFIILYLIDGNNASSFADVQQRKLGVRKLLANQIPSFGPSSLTAARATPTCNSGEIIAYENFDDYDSTWSNQQGRNIPIEAIPGYGNILGRFYKHYKAAFKTFTVPVDSESIIISFRLFEFDIWDDIEYDDEGTGGATVRINGVTISLGEFLENNQLKEDGYSSTGDGITLERKSDGTLEMIGANSAHNDQIHRVTISVPRSMYIDTGGDIEFKIKFRFGNKFAQSAGIDEFKIIACKSSIGTSTTGIIPTMSSVAETKTPDTALSSSKFPSTSYIANPIITTTYKASISEGIDCTASSHKIPFEIVAAALSLFAFITGVVFLLTYLVNRRHEKWLGSLSKKRLFVLQKFQSEKEGKEVDLNVMAKSMFQSSAIPAFWRYAIPIILLGNIAIFLGGHLSIGATVNIEAQVAGEALRVEKLFCFSMAQSAIEMWEAGAKLIALLVLIFSGIWPYSKTLITLTLWFLPPTTVSISRRGSILLWFDALAKWSMVDAFVLIISIVTFRVSNTSPDTDVMVVPLWGLYANVIAQLLSQLSSHLIVHYHRKTVRNAMRQYEAIHGEASNFGNTIYSDNYIVIDPNVGATTEAEKQRDSLYNHAFSSLHRGKDDKLVTRCYVNYLLCLVSIALVVFLFLGCYYPSFSVEILYIFGVDIESGQHSEEAITYHNLFSAMKLLVGEASFLNKSSHYFGLGALISICFICVIVVPLVQATALAYQWFFLMTKKTRKNLSIFLEILQAWQYSEVYIISITVASWQFGPVSDFIINEYCDAFDDQLSMLDYFNFLNNKDDRCFQLKATIQNSAYFLAASVALLILVNTFIMKATKQYFSYSNNNNTANHTTTKSDKKVETLFLGYDEVRWNNATETKNENKVYIQLPPVLFTDTFRWLLQREDIDIAMQSESFFNNDEERTLVGEMSIYSNDEEQYSSGCYIAAQERESLTETSEFTSLSILSATEIDVLPSNYAGFEAKDGYNKVENDD